ncbi:hypothetical protein C8R46DRAFT_1171711 [Mycena filopes]|nr:hypothetical protein C8R46DRAFT_1171711 [Mycena filopes]
MSANCSNRSDLTSSIPPITLHWLEKSRAQRILWLLEHLHLHYQLKTYKRDPATGAAPPALKEIHPLGKSPVITIRGRTLAESALIVEYLSEHFDKLEEEEEREGRGLIPRKWVPGQEGTVGGETAGYMRYRYFMHYCEGSLMPLALLAVLSKDNKEYVKTSFTTHFKFLEAQLESAPQGGPYLCGPTLSGADIMMGFPVLLGTSGWGDLGIDHASFPRLFAYAEALKKVESYRRAEERADELERRLGGSE